MNRRTLITALLIATVSLTAHAHGGMIHVMGTVTALTDSTITVTTTDKRSVEVVLTETTTYENGTKPATRKELKVGDRVVIHAVKVKDALQAHEVRFSEGTATSAH
jgi:hypothetical protein